MKEPKRKQAPSGLSQFFKIWKSYTRVAFVALAATSMPFIAYLGQLIPPWPTGVTLITAMVELIVLVLSFQLLWKVKRKVASRTMIMSATLLVILSVAYLALFSLVTYEVPRGDRGVKGFVCTELATRSERHGAQCPFVSQEAIKDFAYYEDRIWTANSIGVSRMALLLTWLGSFAMLSVTIGSFVIFQARVKA